MLGKIRSLYRKIYLGRLVKKGMKLGKNFQFEKGSNIDAVFPWLVEIGDNVTFASWVYVVTHDGASQKHVGYSRVGKVKIGNNVFVGTKATIFPNVTIGDNCIIGANSVVTSSIPANSVAVGIPAKVIIDIETYKKKQSEAMKHSPVYEKEYTQWGGIDSVKKEQMKRELEGQSGFIV